MGTDDDEAWDSDDVADRRALLRDDPMEMLPRHQLRRVVLENHQRYRLDSDEYALFRHFLAQTNHQEVLQDFEHHVIVESNEDRWPLRPLYPAGLPLP